MKKVIIPLLMVGLVLPACEIVQKVVQESGLIDSKQFINGNLWQTFNRASPVSTSFDDAVYEAFYLQDFEPGQLAYRPLDIQPRADAGGYVLKSGVYSMNARSFCLRGYTHGPSRGDGHLYAPLKGKKADFIQAIIERYGERSAIPQQKVQVLLWAIIAGADMNSLGARHSETLNALFTFQELLEFQGKDWLNGFADQQIEEFRQLALDQASPKLRNLLRADEQIRTMVRQNRTFREIEKIAIIAGVAPPEDMIREVSKGRWSYHPDGFFVRFFPNGYAQTRVDVYVPFQDEVAFDPDGNPYLSDEHASQVKEAVFNPATMVATPANQSSQKIGVSSVPVSPTPPDTDKYTITFLAYPRGKKYLDKYNKEQESQSGHVFVAFSKNKQIEQVKGFSPVMFSEIEGKVDENTDEGYLLKYHDILHCVNVDKTSYLLAKDIRKEDYLLGFDDCVSYADDVADMIGLDTPTLLTDPIDFSFPMSFVRYLQRNNPDNNTAHCPKIAKHSVPVQN